MKKLAFSDKYKKLFSFEEMSFLGDKYKKLRSCLRSVLNYLLRKRPPGQTNILNENQSKFGFNFNINFKQLIFMSILISKSLGCLHLAEDYYIWLSFPRKMCLHSSYMRSSCLLVFFKIAVINFWKHFPQKHKWRILFQ